MQCSILFYSILPLKFYLTVFFACRVSRSQHQTSISSDSRGLITVTCHLHWSSPSTIWSSTLQFTAVWSRCSFSELYLTPFPWDIFYHLLHSSVSSLLSTGSIPMPEPTSDYSHQLPDASSALQSSVPYCLHHGWYYTSANFTCVCPSATWHWVLCPDYLCCLCFLCISKPSTLGSAVIALGSQRVWEQRCVEAESRSLKVVALPLKLEIQSIICKYLLLFSLLGYYFIYFSFCIFV